MPSDTRSRTHEGSGIGLALMNSPCLDAGKVQQRVPRLTASWSSTRRIRRALNDCFEGKFSLEAPFFLSVAGRVMTLLFLVYRRSLVPSFI